MNKTEIQQFFNDNTFGKTDEKDYSKIYNTERDKKDGDVYLITGEDYQGLTIINCTQHWSKSWLPKSTTEGLGFCMSSAMISKNGMYLAITGCYWGGEYDVRIYDFSKPENLPYTILNIAPTVTSFETYETFGENYYSIFVKLDEYYYEEESKWVYYEDHHKEIKLLTNELDEKFNALTLDEKEVYRKKAAETTRTTFELCLKYLCENSNASNYIYHPEKNELELLYNL